MRKRRSAWVPNATTPETEESVKTRSVGQRTAFSGLLPPRWCRSEVREKKEICFPRDTRGESLVFET